MAILYTNAKTSQEKVVDIIVSSSILDNIKRGFEDEARRRLGDAYERIAKDNKKRSDDIAIIAAIYPNREYCGNVVAKKFEGQLRLIKIIRNEFAHEERFRFLLMQDRRSKEQKEVDKNWEDVLVQKDEALDIRKQNSTLCSLLTRNDKDKNSIKDNETEAINAIHELSLDALYSLFDYSFNQVRTFIQMYVYDGPERNEYLFGIVEERNNED